MGLMVTFAESEAYRAQKRRIEESKRQIPNHPTTSWNRYRYRSLNSSTHEIRLLQLANPPVIKGQTNYSLLHLSLDSNGNIPLQERCRYEALSYTWSDRFGNADLATSILIDGHDVQVTSNLAAALRVIFQRDKRKLVWADAVCIDQSDTTERNHQVSKMKLVYEKAERVITWLGEEYENSAKAFEFFALVLRRGVKSAMSEAWVPWRTSAHIVREVWAVIRLFSRDYWRRVWVLQELKFAKDVLFCVGSRTIEWGELKRVQLLLWNSSKVVLDVLQSTEVGHMGARLWQDGPNIVQVGQGIWQDGSNLVGLGQESEMSNAERLGAMLVKHRRKDATDPRDKVFAVLALCNGAVKESITVDYDLDTSTVFLEATRFAIEQEQDLLILAENKDRNAVQKMGFTLPSRRRSSRHPNRISRSQPNETDSDTELALTTLDLPSWVPNFALPPTRQKSRISEWCQHYALPTTGTVGKGSLSKEPSKQNTGLYISAAGSTKPQISISHDGRVLSTAAIRIGTVIEVSSKTMPAFEAEEFDFHTVYKVLRAWFLTFSKHGGIELEGEGGLLDLVLLGGLYKVAIGTEQRKAWITEVLIDLKILVQRNFSTEAEEQFLQLLSAVEVEEHLPFERIRAAEVNLFGATHRCKERSLVVLTTPQLQFAIGPECVAVGDLIVALSGCAVPIVLRKRDGSSGDGWCIIGDAYVNEFMDGKAVEGVGCDGKLMETFDIH